MFNLSICIRSIDNLSFTLNLHGIYLQRVDESVTGQNILRMLATIILHTITSVSTGKSYFPTHLLIIQQKGNIIMKLLPL